MNFTYTHGTMLWDIPLQIQTPIFEKNTSTSISSDGSILASISKSNRNIIQLWDTTTGENITTIEHTYNINIDSGIFSPDATMLAFRGESIYLWDVITGERITTIIPNRLPKGFSSLTFSPDGSILAAKKNDGSIITLWDIITGEYLLSFSIIGNYQTARNPIVFSPDGTTLAIHDELGLCLWDVATSNELARIKGISAKDPIAFSPDGTTLASGTSDGDIKLWDISKWTQTRPYSLVKISGDNQQGAPGVALPNPLIVKAIDRNGNPCPGAQVQFRVTLGAGRLGKKFSVQNTTTDTNGQAECTFTLGNYSGSNSVEVFMGRRKFVTFYAKGMEIPDAIDMDGDYRKWALPDGAKIRLGKGGTGKSSRAVAFSPNGKQFAVASQIGIWFYDVDTAREMTLLPTESPIHSVGFSPDGATIISEISEAINTWNVETGEKIDTWETEHIEVITFSPDGKIAVSIDANKTVTSRSKDKIISLWDVETGTKTVTLEGYKSRLYSIAFTPNGNIIALGYGDGIVKLWDIETGKNLMILKGQKGVNSMAFSSDGKILASSELDKVRLWNLETRQNFQTFNHTERVYSLSFSVDGKMLASAGYTILLWDTVTGENIATLEGHLRKVNSLAFSLDGNKLASTSSQDGVAKLWDINTQNAIDLRHESIKAMPFSPDGIQDPAGLGYESANSMLFSPDGNMLARKSTHVVQLWNVITGEDIAAFKPIEVDSIWRSSMWFSADGSIFAIEGYDVHLWDTTTQTPIIDSQIISSVSPAPPPNKEGLSPDGEIRATASNGTLEVSSVTIGETIATISYININWIHSLSFSSDGNMLAIGSYGMVKLWNISTDLNITVLEKKGRHEALFSPNGNTLALKSDDTILLYDMESLNSQFALLAPASVNLTDTLQTELLRNYPNPFNPETWIPFRLAENAKVTLTIYDADGRMVRSLDVGHKKAGIYESRNKAIYWDGRNDLGERVASGVYFYHLMAGDYSATKRMVILK